MGRMTLLSRSAVEKAKAIDRQKEVEEGKKLATRVDGLRKLSADEEKNLYDFRDKTLGVIKAKVATANEELSTVEGQLKTRKEELILLMKPIDSKWGEVNEAKKMCGDWERQLETRQEYTDKVLKEVAEHIKQLEKSKLSIKEDEIRVKKLLSEASSLVIQANKIISDAHKQSDAEKAELLLKEQTISTRESNIIAREEQAKIAEENNLRVHHQNNIDRVIIEDDRVILTKAWDELKRKNIES